MFPRFYYLLTEIGFYLTTFYSAVSFSHSDLEDVAAKCYYSDVDILPEVGVYNFEEQDTRGALLFTGSEEPQFRPETNSAVSGNEEQVLIGAYKPGQKEMPSARHGFSVWDTNCNGALRDWPLRNRMRVRKPQGKVVGLQEQDRSGKFLSRLLQH